MPQNILIAALGEHPAVVTGMVKALREFEDIWIDSLYVLYPENTGQDIAQLGYPLIEEHLDGVCDVWPVPLGFPDANTTDRSIEFLRILVGVLEPYRDKMEYNVYLSLAGGRKNMSALMALVSQFFPTVKGLYHLLDKEEDSFPSIWQLVDWPRQKSLKALDPPIENMNLVPIPYPGTYSSASELRTWLNGLDPDNESAAPIALTPEAEQFFRSIFTPNTTYQQLQVWLSENAYTQYQSWTEQGNNFAPEFMTCFKQMRDPNRLKDRKHGTFGQFHFYKRRRTRIRPFFYTKPNPIVLHPQQPVERVIVCGLSVEQGNGQYDPTAEKLLASAKRQPYKHISQLNTRERILLVPLGTSPMIATQTYTLLQESQDEGKPNIPTVAVLYPEYHDVIENGVDLLEEQFEERGVEFKRFPIEEVEDIDSPEDCECYLQTLLAAIEELRTQYPERSIALSLSGGRKAMSALTLFAAQRAAIEQVYHTLITDIELEERIEEETNLNALDKLPTDDARAKRLFLEEYDHSHFQLFAIPVIPFS